MTITPVHKDELLVQDCTDAILGVNKPTFEIGRYMTVITFPGEGPVWAHNDELLRAFIQASGSGLK